MRTFGAWGAGLVLAFLAGACSFLSKEEVDSVPTQEYPAWASALLADDTSIVARATLRGRQGAIESSTVEQMVLREGPQGSVARVRVDRPLQRITYDAVYDAAGKPLRFWRRVSVPGVLPARIDVRLFELRTQPIAISHRDPDGARDFAQMRRNESPIALIGEAFSLLTPWIRHANLAVGGVVRGRSLDTDKGGVMRNAALRRSEDMNMPEHGGRVRVYRVYGRDVVFANDQNIVVGSLSGFVSIDPNGPAMPPQASEDERVDPTRTP